MILLSCKLHDLKISSLGFSSAHLCFKLFDSFENKFGKVKTLVK